MKRITVHLYKSEPKRLLKKRPQMWRWRAQADNGRIIATSGEAFTNRQDAVDSIQALFADDTDVYLDTGNGLSGVIRTGRPF